MENPSLDNTEGCAVAHLSGGQDGVSVSASQSTTARETPKTPRAKESNTPSQKKHRRSPRKKKTVREREEDAEINGYDTDDEPCFDAIEREGEQEFDEDATAAPTGAPDDAPPSETPVSMVGSFLDIEENTLKSLKVTDIKAELKCRGKSDVGRKADLMDRLRKALREKAVFVTEPPNRSVRAQELSGFPPTAYWELLVPQETPVPEPENTFAARAPTVPADEADVVPVKHNYNEQFDRPVFTGRAEVFVKNKDGSLRLDTNGNTMKRTEIRSVESHPVEWMESLHPGFNEWTTNTNMKAMLSNAGQVGQLYSDFKPFEVKDVKQMVGLYYLNGLSPSPKVEMKFQPQATDPINGNDLVYQSFPPNASRRLRHFKKFFCIRSPLHPKPLRRADQPNFKVDPLLEHMNKIFQSAWLPGKSNSGDEQTIGFQGRHKDKRRITFKDEGDGFQCDALCDDGYTYTFYFRNQPAPSKYLKQGLSPLHARVMALFETLPDDWHRVGLDNLYMSAKFCQAAYGLKVLIGGVARKGGRGLPQEVVQQEETNRQRQMNVRGTVKAAVLKGVPNCPDLIATSVYDTKPVHFLSMFAEKIEWVEKERKVFNPEEERMQSMRFLRLNINDDYNNNMGDVDISDQKRGYYRFDHWMRKTKWWWAIWFWAEGVMKVNAYVMYCAHCREQGVDPKKILSSYDFQAAIALAWINPEQHDPRCKAMEVERERKRKRRSGSPSCASISSLSPATASTSGPTTRRQQQAKDLPEEETNLKAVRFTDAALGKKGTLNKRRRVDLKHRPGRPVQSNVKCQLHRWAAGVQHRAGILWCKDCRVHLCVDCFGTFHDTEDLVADKKELGKRFASEKKASNNVQDAHLGLEIKQRQAV